MKEAIQASITAVMFLVNGSAIGDVTVSGNPDNSLFDPSRGVILRGGAAQTVAEMCGAQDDSKAWKIAPSDVRVIEEELAPILATDLARVRSSASPHEYYRQYASGTFANRKAIFINGFHESYFSMAKNAPWRSQPVTVLDGGTEYWCAIYVEGVKDHFVTYKANPSGAAGLHVSFHGEA